jgi:hypothetical protein
LLDIILFVGFLVIIVLLWQCFRPWSKALLKIPSSTISPLPRIIVFGQSTRSANVVDGLRAHGYQVLSLPRIDSSLQNLSALAILALSNDDVTNLLICRMLRQQDASIRCYAMCNDTRNISLYKKNRIISFAGMNDCAVEIINIFPKLESRRHS